jgi:hypothetical protein
VEAEGSSASFSIRLTNAGAKAIHKAGAAVCVSFMGAPWWSDEKVFVLSDGRVRALSELGMDAGLPNSFQAYLVKGQSYDHLFFHRFWGFNWHRLDAPIMVSEHTEAGVCVGVQASRAYFLHCNRGNPCTDLMMAFGDLAPGQTREAGGSLWIRKGSGKQVLLEAAESRRQAS